MSGGGRNNSGAFREQEEGNDEFVGLSESRFDGAMKAFLYWSESKSPPLTSFFELDYSESMLSVLALEYIRGTAIASALHSCRANEASKAKMQGLKSLFLSAIVDEPAVIPAGLTPPQVHGFWERYHVLRYTGQEEYGEIVRRKGAFGYLLDRVAEVDSKEAFGVIYFPSCLELGNMVIWRKLTSADNYSISTCTIDNQFVKDREDRERKNWAVCTYNSQDAFDRAVQHFIDEGMEAAERDHRDSSARIAFFSSKYHEYCAGVRDIPPSEAPPRSSGRSVLSSRFFHSPSIAIRLEKDREKRQTRHISEVVMELDQTREKYMGKFDQTEHGTNTRLTGFNQSMKETGRVASSFGQENEALRATVRETHVEEVVYQQKEERRERSGQFSTEARDLRAHGHGLEEVHQQKEEEEERGRSGQFSRESNDLHRHEHRLEQQSGEVQEDQTRPTTCDRAGDEDMTGRVGSGGLDESSSRSKGEERESADIGEQEGSEPSRPANVSSLSSSGKLAPLPLQKPRSCCSVLMWVLKFLLLLVVSTIGLLVMFWACGQCQD